MICRTLRHGFAPRARRQLRFALSVLGAACLCAPAAPQNSTSTSQTLFARSLHVALVHTAPHVEFFLYDLRTHQPLDDTFVHSSEPMPVGSLLKPFVALAYGRTHQPPYPTIQCAGRSARCWKAHGAITLSDAIAQSCNAYFLALARDVQPESAFQAMAGLPPPPPDATPEVLIGIRQGWLLTPHDLVLGYAALLERPRSLAEQAILAGMLASAHTGTAARIGPHHGGVLAKTGTAPCIDTHCLATGDGLVLAAVPAAHPVLLLLVRRRGTTGAVTAASAGGLLTQLETLHAY